MNEIYSEQQVYDVLKYIGVDIIGETETNFLCLCVFHKNTDSPALSISKESGLYLCFSPMCEAAGNLTKLVMEVARVNLFGARRLITKFQTEINRVAAIDDLLKPKELPTFDQAVLNRLHDQIWDSEGQKYFNEKRGINDKTIAYFGLGYSQKQGMVTIPLHDPSGKPLGMIGRTIEGKRFKNTKHLPTRRVLFNLHRAKTKGGTVIIVEAAMDALRIHQAGFPCVVSTNGGFFTEHHRQLIATYFDKIIIMTDMDDPEEHRDVKCRKCEGSCLGHNPGRALGEKIANDMFGKTIYWGCYSDDEVYPHDAKDVGNMTDEEIVQCVNNAKNRAEYEWMKREIPLLSRV